MRCFLKLPIFADCIINSYHEQGIKRISQILSQQCSITDEPDYKSWKEMDDIIGQAIIVLLTIKIMIVLESRHSF